ncbi:hypothetical protein B0H11DRAFT_1851247 [Mycena galericulata]|nr:hypothetical protein B0H11DRAFT_1851247 [Mycena galericulata]
MAPKPRPHLPEECITRLLAEPWMKGSEKSFIFSTEFSVLRLKFVDQSESQAVVDAYAENFAGGFFRYIDEDKGGPSTPLAKLMPRWIGNALPAQERYREYSFLHAAVDETDPLLACEMIRIGACIDATNGRGQTPLLQALERAWELQSLLTMVAKTARVEMPHEVLGYKQTLENAHKKIRFIAIVLIDQHADTNATVGWQGKVVSSLHFACAKEDWDLVASLLKHGAQRKPTHTCADVEFFLGTAAAKRRFTALQTKANGTSRPPRLCPCFSGKPLSNCHSKELPYPEEFTCSCGSAKTFKKCCKTRNLALKEIWAEESQRIVPERETARICSLSPSAMAALVEQIEQARQRGETELILSGATGNLQAFHRECSELARREKVGDPAFIFAYAETGCLPWPQARTRSKHESRQIQKAWNDAVDKYIASGIDPRPRFEIEAAAKIGISLGAMIRVCEAIGCDRVEGSDVEKVSVCGRCKMTFYCGATCQKLHWPVHKKVCGKDGHLERPLPSQVVLRKFAERMLKRSPFF